MLTTNSPAYSKRCKRENHIDTIVQVEVITMGLYSFLINSFNVCVSLHKDYYDSTSKTKNLLFTLPKPCANKFQFTTHLQPSTKYVLAIRTDDPELKGLLSVLVTGPSNVSLKSIGEYFDYILLQTRFPNLNKISLL